MNTTNTNTNTNKIAAIEDAAISTLAKKILTYVYENTSCTFQELVQHCGPEAIGDKYIMVAPHLTLFYGVSQVFWHAFREVSGDLRVELCEPGLYRLPIGRLGKRVPVFPGVMKSGKMARVMHLRMAPLYQPLRHCHWQPVTLSLRSSLAALLLLGEILGKQQQHAGKDLPR